MRLQLNDNWVEIPSSLEEITLKQRINYQIQVGNELDLMIKSILEMPDDEEKELEIVLFNFEKMIRTFAFFTDCTAEAIKESEFIDRIADIYYANLACIFEQESKMELQELFEWNGEIWKIDNPFIKHGSGMRFGELIDAKQIVQDLVKLGKSQWEVMLPLCAIYLRKEDELYDKSFLYEDSDRLKLMETLPLNIAMQVGFFLSGSLNMFTKAFQFSTNLEQKQPADIPRNTLPSLAG